MHWFFCIYIHAVCMFHATCMDLGRSPCMHISMHVTCILHACNNLVLDSTFPRCSSFELGIDTRTYVSRSEVSVTCDIDRFKTNTYVTYLAHPVFLTMTNMHQASHLNTCNLHITCLLFACCCCYMHCICYSYIYFNVHTCICRYCNMHVVSTCTTHDYNIEFSDKHTY
jgi:hypothetical protein